MIALEGLISWSLGVGINVLGQSMSETGAKELGAR